MHCLLLDIRVSTFCPYVHKIIVTLVPIIPPNFSQPVIKIKENQSIQVFFKVQGNFIVPLCNMS